MHWSWRSPLFLLAAPVIVGAAVLAAQNVNDLPAAPSEVIKPKPAPPQKTSPPSEQQPSSSNPKGAEASNSTDGSAPQSKQEDEPVLEGPTIPVQVNLVSVVFTVTDKHNHYVKPL